MAEMARRLRVGTSAIEFAIRSKNSEELGKCYNCELCPPAVPGLGLMCPGQSYPARCLIEIHNKS